MIKYYSISISLLLAFFPNHAMETSISELLQRADQLCNTIEELDNSIIIGYTDNVGVAKQSSSETEDNAETIRQKREEITKNTKDLINIMRTLNKRASRSGYDKKRIDEINDFIKTIT